MTTNDYTNKQSVSDSGSTVIGHCPAHGAWSKKFPLELSETALSQVDCPKCESAGPSMKAISMETVTLTGSCGWHGKWSRNVPKFAEQHMQGRCPKCDEELKQRQDEEERRRHNSSHESKKRAHIRELVDQSGIPRRFITRSFENFTVDPEVKGMQEVFDRARRYAHRFDQVMTRGASMIFYGSPGTGKNHLAASIANYVIPTFGIRVLFITVYELMQRVRATYNKNSEQSEDQLLKELGDLDLLILDEVGVQLGTKHEEVILTDVINRRYADVRPTILLSNLAREDLESQLGTRIIDRMEEGGGGSLAFNWGSYRGRVLEDKALKNPKFTLPNWLSEPDPEA